MNKIEDTFCIAVADYIKDYIKDNNIDLADLAAAANVDRKQVYRLINKENIPLLSTVVKIALAAGLKINIGKLQFNFDEYKANNKIFTAIPKDNKD
ncbi:helix-turn-helix domain-containing protein [Chryseobacterium sp. Leaf394]|uniref:helix-turn-helix domain-containing protein n=1 Tax=Chryseobacterium sp. Leaf394 TaxID=1736361 RepID=UPI0006F1ED78|nr:helix-turn-helix domain-containing protein [Chryseobacterium sp. Leaf394]KQS91743.1 hypothetical protein ASG21_04575 [Chryseobacterium sp. Leaf394]